MERSTIFTYFCHFRNFIVSYISNCMVVMYQSTFFFTGTAEHTHTHTRTHAPTHRRTHLALTRLVFLEGRSCFTHSLSHTHTHTFTHNQYSDHTVLLVPCKSHVLFSHMNKMDFVKSIKNRTVTERRLLVLSSEG